MIRKKIEILEKAFAAEISAALYNLPGCIQSKTKAAQELLDDGYLVQVDGHIPGNPPVKVRGLVLSELGRMTYCAYSEELETAAGAKR